MPGLSRIGWAAWLARPPVGAVILVAVFSAFSYRFFFSQGYLPLHDTGFFFQVFKIAYSNFFHTGALPEWMAQGVFGYQAHLQNILVLSPLSYPVMALGKLFGAQDALVLFKVVVLLEVCVFSLGFLRLADAFFDNKWVSLLALAPLLMTTVVINQITFMFRIVYLVPLMTVYMLGFIKTGKVWKFVVAGVVVLAAVFGTNAYFLVYYVIYGAVFCAAAYVACGKNFRPVFGRTAVLGAVAGLLFAGVCCYLVLSAIDGLAFVVAGRDPVTLKVDLETFLNHGGGGAVKMLEMLMAAPFATAEDPLAILDVTFYVPAAAFVFAVYAFFRERDALFLAVAFVFTVMVVLCWGRYSPVAYALYYIPGVSYLRNLGLLYAVPKMLFCLIAGFGVQHFLTAASSGAESYGRECRFLAVIALLVAVTVIIILAASILVTGKLEWLSPRTALVAWSAAGFVVVAVTASHSAIRERTLMAVLAVMMMVQGGGYLMGINAIFTNGFKAPAAVKEEISRARIFPFDETRPVVSAHPRFGLWRAFDPGRSFSLTYMALYGALGMDICFPVVPKDKVDVFSPGVGDLVRHQFGPGADVRQLGAFHRESPDAVFFRLAGCGGRSKLQLITRFEEDVLDPSKTVSAAAMGSAVLVERTETGERRLVRSVAGEYPNATSLASQGITVSEFSANRLVAEIKVAGPGGAWLVYADGFHPGWRAKVNGQAVPVWKANMAFKALYLPGGVNAVIFDFTHWGWQWAVWFVAFASVLVIVLGSVPAIACLLAGFKKKQPKGG